MCPHELLFRRGTFAAQYLVAVRIPPEAVNYLFVIFGEPKHSFIAQRFEKFYGFFLDPFRFTVHERHI